MFDHTLDPEELVDEWLQGFHGPVGGPLVKQFLALIVGNVAPGFDGCFGSCETAHAKFLPPLAVLQAVRPFLRIRYAHCTVGFLSQASGSPTIPYY